MKVKELIQHLERVEREKKDLDVVIWKPGERMSPEAAGVAVDKSGRHICFIEVSVDE